MKANLIENGEFYGSCGLCGSHDIECSLVKNKGFHDVGYIIENGMRMEILLDSSVQKGPNSLPYDKYALNEHLTPKQDKCIRKYPSELYRKGERFIPSHQMRDNQN